MSPLPQGRPAALDARGLAGGDALRGDLSTILTIRDARQLAHRLNNSLQRALGEAEMLAERARELRSPVDFRAEIATLIDRLDQAGRTSSELQELLGGTGANRGP